jgi:hypothetical protein
VLRVRDGIIEEIGIASKRLTLGRGGDAQVLHGVPLRRLPGDGGCLAWPSEAV